MLRLVARMGIVFGLGVAVAAPALAQTFLGPSTVDTGGYFYRYVGPLGHGIYSGGGTPLADNATTWFRDRSTGNQMAFAPDTPYDNYPWPAFGGSGTGIVDLTGSLPSGPGGSSQFWTGAQGVDFWIQSGAQPDPVNVLTITGATTTGVELDPATLKSGPVKLATFTYTNGTWFGSDPPVDPGLGELYPVASFAYSLIATPTPLIGSNPFPGGYHVFNSGVTLTTTFGAGTPDYLWFAGLSNLQSTVLAVNEGATASVELWGRIGSLEAVELRNAVNATILSEIPVTPVPEPALALQWVGGLMALAGAARLRARRRAAASAGA